MKHSFSIILAMCVLMTVGLALLPELDVSNQPRPRQGKTLSIHYSWHGASAKVVEQNVTSVIEGLMASVKGVESVSSDSYFGSGRVVVELKDNAPVSATKFEIASLIRQIRKKLPEGVSYPSLTGGEVQTGKDREEAVKHILTYQVNASMTDEQIRERLEQDVKPKLERIDGIHHVDVSGGKSRYMEIAYDAQTLANYGITSYDIEQSIRNFMGKEDIIGDVYRTETDGERIRIPLFLTTGKFAKQLEEMPIKTIDDKIVYLNNLATYTYKDREPNSYYRVNGMNTIYLNIHADADKNIIRLAKVVQESGIVANSDDSQLYFTKTYDRAETEYSEFNTLLLRSGACVLLLFLFVWLCKREWKYLAIIAIGMTLNILMAVIAYWVADIRIHPFSLAGITVSLCFVIDSTIVMTDHYSYYRNHRAFMGILAALITTIGSLVVIFWLPDHLQNDLYDFAWTVIINLCIALIVAAVFVPALVDRLQYNSRQNGKPQRLAFVRGWSNGYRRYVSFVQHRKWIYIVVIILAFGIPFHLLNIFSEAIDNNHRERDEEMRLYIRAQMPLGGTATQLNNKVELLEAFLSQYDEIERFETHINYGGASITVEFKDDVLDTSFPYKLENQVISKVISIGGADWSTYGVSDRGFSNSLNLQHRSSNIDIAGYDYTRLYRYAEEVSAKLSNNNRVTDIIIEVPYQQRQEDELFMVYDREAMMHAEVDAYTIHNNLRSMLAETEVGRYEDKNLRTDLVLRSTDRNKFDLWQLNNSYLHVADKDIRLSSLMDIQRREAKNSISRRNQEYVLRVSFNILGSYTYQHRLIESVVKEMNTKLPVGFRCIKPSYGWNDDGGTKYWLIGIITLIIFFLCAILFESLRQAFVIILLVPTSMIGLFLTYYFSGVPFGSGGFAAMVLLCGMSVNAGIYLINEYNNIYNRHAGNGCHIAIFVKAYNHKIIPILLTVFSTVIGLIPFLFDGEGNEFWYSFAIGSMGGMTFSVLALILFLPIFLIKRR